MKCPKCNADNPEASRFCADCGTQLPDLEKKPNAYTKTLESPKEELTTGSTFAGRYQIIEELGKGGMGKVYKAHDTEITERIALKLIKPEIAVDEKTIERFRNELKFARKVRHKNVCQMYDINKEKGSYYITMEFVDGEDLKSMIRMTKSMSVGTAIDIAKQVCEGLAEAHKLGVIHRDLKSSNIMIDKEGNARIMDFGIARSLKGKGITDAGVMIGTPEYMSPEQVEGKETDQRSDIYSLGAILYEMVTGRVPFEGDTPFTIGVKHKSEIPRDPKEYNSQLSEDFNNVIMKCLEKDKEGRYQSVGELRSELIRIESGLPTTERLVPKKTPLTSKEITVTLGIKKLIVPIVIVLAVIIMAVVIWRILPREKPVSLTTGKPSLAVMYFENNTGDVGLDHWRKALSELLTADLSQSRYISVLSGDKLFNILKELDILDATSYSSEDLEDVASQGGVANIVRGSYSRAGDIFRINIMIQRTKTGELVGSESVEGQGEEGLFAMVDELTKKIKASFELTAGEISTDMDREVRDITTSSPEAYKYYVEGRRYHLDGENRKSIELMERAIAFDPEFAMAYRSMAMSYNNLRLFAERKKYIGKALEFADRLSERERYLIEGDYYSDLEATYEKAIEAYKKLLQLYPDESTAAHNLAIIYGYLGDWDKTAEYYELCRQGGSDFIYSHTQLAYAYSAKGLYDKAEKVVEEYIQQYGDHVLARLALADIHIDLGELNQAREEVDKALVLNPTYYENFIYRGNILLLRGEFSPALQEYNKLLQMEEMAARGMGAVRLIYLYGLQGKFAMAEKVYRQLLESVKNSGQVRWEIGLRRNGTLELLRMGDPQDALNENEALTKLALEESHLRMALYNKGLIFIEMKEMNAAQNAALELKKIIDRGINKNSVTYYHHLMGEISLAKGNSSEAVEYFKKALSLEGYGPLAKRADFQYSLAIAYYKAGNIEEAMKAFEQITSLTSGRLNYGIHYAKSFYMLGKLYQKQGLKDKAVSQYEIFLGLWKEADPGSPELDDAKKAFSELKN